MQLTLNGRQRGKNNGGSVEDQTGLFAQLKQLHAQGLLTDTEYEEKKAALQAKIHQSTLASSRVPAEEHHSATSRARGNRNPVWLLLIFVPLAVLGVYFLARAADSSSPVSDPIGSNGRTVENDSGPWTIRSSTDPMTDATVKSAEATFEANQFKIEVAVTCTSVGEVSYTATSFDKAGKPVEMRTTFDQYGPIIGAQARADSASATNEFTRKPKYSNQFLLTWGPDLYGYSGQNHAAALARAQRVVLRLFMVSGDETITLPQDGSSFRSVVDSCLQQIDAQEKQRDMAATKARDARLAATPMDSSGPSEEAVEADDAARAKNTDRYQPSDAPTNT